MIKKILITGGSGFIGTNLHLKLKKNKNQKILNIDLKKPKEEDLYQDWVFCDIRDLKKTRKIFKKFRPDTVFHLAARTDLRGKSLTQYNSNTIGTNNIIKLIIENKVKRFLYTSTRFVFNAEQSPLNDFDYSPFTVYGKSKVISEEIFFKNIKKLPKNSIITRPTSIWGPYFSEPYFNFFKLIEKKIYFHPTHKKVYKSFGYVENTVAQMIELIKSNKTVKSDIYYLTDYLPYEIYRFANMISINFKKRNILKIHYQISFLIAIFGSFLNFIGLKFPLTLFRLRNMTTESTYKNKNLKKIFNKLPFSMSRGITKTCDWMRDIDK
jgi:nucleoside-diphosphate-sugar epimerase